MKEEAGRRFTAAALAAWLVLQVCTGAGILASTFCTVSFSGRTRALFGAWLLCLLLLDILLYFFGGWRLLRELKWYWAICLVCAAVLPAAGRASLLIAILLPCGQMFLLSYVLLWEGLEVFSWTAVNVCTYALTLLLCVAHAGWLTWLNRRSPVDCMSERHPAAALLLPVWLVLQGISGADALFNSSFWGGAYVTYTAWSWIAQGLWCLSLLGLTATLSSAGRRKTLRRLRQYWLLCALALAALSLLPPLRDAAFALQLLYALLTPLFQILSLCWLLLQKGVGLSWAAAEYAGLFAGMLLCLAQSAYMTWLLRRNREKGAVKHGSVDPGAGVLESES